MQSQAVLSMGIQDLASMAKGDVSKTLFGQIQWEEISKSGVFLTHLEHQLLERAQANLGVVLDNRVDSIDLSRILVKIAENCTSNLTVQQYVFTRIEEILGIGIDLSDADIEAYGSKHSRLFTTDGTNVVNSIFLRALNSPDAYLQQSSSVAFACVLSVCEGNENALIVWINEKLTSTISGAWEVGVPALSMLCRRESCRFKYVASGGAAHVMAIIQRLGANGNAQQLYELVFILWSLSLGPDLEVRTFLSSGMIPTLVDLISAAPSRKVVRMSVGALKNLAATGDDDALTEMLSGGLQRLIDGIVQSHSVKQAGDVEFESDIRALNESLFSNYRELSTFDRWASQVQTGALRPGIVHTEKFWRENARFVEANDFKLLRALIRLLRHDDKAVVGIALYDLGEFTRFYPNGRGVVSTLGGKDIALEMISSDNPTLQRQALQCVSKIMVTNWEFMR